MSDEVFLKRTIQKETFKMAPVEILIPFHGEHSKVSKLVESILRTVWTNRYQITLIDDCSPNVFYIEEIRKAKMPGVVCLRLDKHKGFGAAVNHALANPKNPWIPWVVVMHSDVVVEDSTWLSDLGQTMQRLKEQGVKMVSPRTNNPGQENQHLKGMKESVGDDFILGDGFLPMYCALFHRELWQRLGPLKEYPYAGCEVEDYAQRLRSCGYKQGISGTSWVYHEGGGTLNNLSKSKKVQEILRKNRERFLVESKNGKL